MATTRRSFMQGLGALLGLGAVAKAVEPEPEGDLCPDCGCPLDGGPGLGCSADGYQTSGYATWTTGNPNDCQVTWTMLAGAEEDFRQGRAVDGDALRAETT